MAVEVDGVQAQRRVEIRMPGAELQQPWPAARLDRRDDLGDNPGPARLLQHLVAIGIEITDIKMTVGIDDLESMVHNNPGWRCRGAAALLVHAVMITLQAPISSFDWRLHAVHLA